MGLVSLLFSFHGRISRGQYWLGSLLVTIIGIVLMGLLFVLSGASFDPSGSKDAIASAVLTLVLIVFLVALPMTYCQVALQVKRLHDRGRTGYLALIPLALSAVIAFTAVSAAFSGASLAQLAGASTTLSGVLWLIQIAMLIDLGLLSNVAGPNKYGDPAGSPPSPVAPTTPKRSTKSAAATASIFGGAEHAIDRAAEQHRRMAAQAKPLSAPAPGPAAGGFGRRVSPR